MNVLSVEARTVNIDRWTSATYECDHRWRITERVPRGAARGSGIRSTPDLLGKLPEGSFERDRALRIIEAFGDS